MFFIFQKTYTIIINIAISYTLFLIFELGVKMASLLAYCDGGTLFLLFFFLVSGIKSIPCKRPSKSLPILFTRAWDSLIDTFAQLTTMP